LSEAFAFLKRGSKGSSFPSGLYKGVVSGGSVLTAAEVLTSDFERSGCLAGGLRAAGFWGAVFSAMMIFFVICLDAEGDSEGF
jgi:hypothetical protein